MAEGDDVTLPELGRRLDRIERKLDNLGVVHIDTYEADKRTAAEQRAALERRVKALEDARVEDARRAEDVREKRWSAWVAPVITAVVAAVIIAMILQNGAK